MKLISVNVGLPREVQWRGKTVRTSIWKHPVDGRVRVSRLNVDGDRQSDPDAHGGVNKALYVYPFEHYAYWKNRLPDAELPFGAFGENFTTEGLLEDQVQSGDRFRAGTAEFVVTQPRMPCYKLAVRFDRPAMVKHFLQSKRTGFYFAVRREGHAAAGDPIEPIERERDSLTIVELVELYTATSPDQEKLRRAVQLAALPAGWRQHFLRRIGTAPR
jgi:MOSC domain-containing protein YiiM